MGKIGRNDPCPCGSGKKFKKCCLQQSAPGPAVRAQKTATPPTLHGEIEKIQLEAIAKKGVVHTVGVFILFSTDDGDGWLLEVTDMDAVQIAAGGEKLDIDLEENAETIEINWTHKFAIKNKKLILTSYIDKTETTLESCPTHAISAAIKKIHKNVPPELRERIHISESLMTETGS